MRHRAFLALLSLAVTYTQQVKPILDAHCVECHSSRAELNLASFPFTGAPGEQPAIVGRLLTKVGAKPPVMPPGNRPKLTTSQVGVIRSWLEGGLLP